MSADTPEPDGQEKAGNGSNLLYANPAEALKKVTSEFEYWTGKLTETSLQMCYALIGANWVIFGSINGILSSPWAKWSLVMVLLALASNVIGAWILSESLRSRIAHGEGEPTKWADEYKKSAGQGVAWPFTDAIQNTGKYMRWIKAGFTLASGLCLIIGVILKGDGLVPQLASELDAPAPNSIWKPTTAMAHTHYAMKT